MSASRDEFVVQRTCLHPSMLVIVQVLKFYFSVDANGPRWTSTAGEVKWFLGCYTRPVTLLPCRTKRE